MAVDPSFPLGVDSQRGQQNTPPVIVMPEPDPYISSTEDQPNPSPSLAQPEVPSRPLILSFHPLLDPQSPQMHPIIAMASSSKPGPVHLRLKPSRPLILGRKHKWNLPRQPERGGYKAVSRRHAIIWIEDGDKVYIKDTKSLNGTYINGNRLSPEGMESEARELMNDDIIQLGVDIPYDLPSPSEPPGLIRYHKTIARIGLSIAESDVAHRASPQTSRTGHSTERDRERQRYQEENGSAEAHLSQSSPLRFPQSSDNAEDETQPYTYASDRPPTY